ncbi:FAD dependent oxidoreductase [Podospora didyma]|uniref:FAD dependent oxidoreductase n=1 Tax=Podospora didyma TaxID=330526 RepID=A0AAE0K171_9PEZI|nr:FAD dependent oxidoreductase [Podospora didyma]
MVFDVIVVGAGVWGAASVEAYEKAGRSVIWIDDNDDEHPTAASADIARIIRAEYSDPAYRKLAEESLQSFKTQEPYSKYFHQTGWFLIQDEQQARHGSIPSGTEDVAVEEFRRKFSAANVDDNLFITRTENVGWVEANNLQQALNAEIRVKKRRGTVTDLIFDGRFCRGVRLGTEDILGEAVVLATGWRTNRLLASHNLAQVDYQVVGVPVLGIQLTDEQYMKYRDMPILCQPGRGEILPPTAQRIMRVNNPRSFHLNSSSAAPTSLSPTHICFKENWDFLGKYFPDLVDRPAVISKICWDALTDSQSFCILQVEGTNNVYYVGGGSFHSWKFRPVLPELIAARLGLKGDDNSEELWVLLTQEQSKKHADLIPTRRWE